MDRVDTGWSGWAGHSTWLLTHNFDINYLQIDPFIRESSAYKERQL